MFLGANRPLLSAKVPGSELARVLLADSLQGANWPGSDKAATLFPARNSEPEITVTEIVLLGPVGF